MKKTSFLIILAASIALSSCYRHCAEFPKEFQQHYFPYSPGQVLTFANSMGDTVTLNVTDLTQSKPYKIAWNVKESCAPNMIVKMQGNVESVGVEFIFMVFNRGQREYDSEGGNPTYNELYDILVTFMPNQFNYTMYDGERYYSRIEGMLDSLNFVSIRDQQNSPDRIINTFAVAKDKGLVSFTTTDGQEYKLAN